MHTTDSAVVALFAIAFSLTGVFADEPIVDKRDGMFDPQKHHQQLLDTTERAFAFRENADFESWQPQLRGELMRILALPEARRSPLNASVTADESTEDYDSYRVVFEAEAGVNVPCFLLKPKERSGPLPVMICLQGHMRETGMLVSIGRAPSRGGRDIALQAVRHGWAALAVEQRCFGERRGDCQRESAPLVPPAEKTMQ